MHQRLLLALCALAATAAVAATPPELRLPDAARPLDVAADLTIVPDRDTFDGRITISLELLAPTDLLWLNANRLEIDSATLTFGDATIEATTVPGGEQFVGLGLGREVPAGPASVTITYRGRLEEVETEGLFRQRSGDDWYVFSQFESIFARRAFPCFDEPSFRTPWKLTLHVPAELEAVANMAAVAERPEPDGMKAVEFAPTPAIPSYLVALGVGPFEYVDGGRWGRGKTPVRIVVPRGKKDKAAFAAEVTGPILAELEEYFDLPYAFGKLDYLVVPHTVSFGAMENPGLVTYAERGILMDESSATLERKRSYASTTAHENAHMWFGNYVTIEWWDDIWLNEGFATWMATKTVASWRPDWWQEGDRHGRRGWALSADSRSNAQSVRRPIRATDDIETAFDGISYAKGGALLEMFEQWLGAERFRDAVRAYVRAHALGNATSDDFLAALGAKGGKEVAAAFASFLDQPGMPVVTFAVSCEGEGAPRLELAQRRYTALGVPANGEQLWRIPVVARVGAGKESREVRTILDSPSSSIELSFCPQWVSGNADGVGYYVAEHQGGLFDQLVARVESLPVGEQIALLSDASMLVAAGSLTPAQSLGLLPSSAGSPHRQVVAAAIRIAGSVSSNLVDDSVRPNYERFLRSILGERARELGLAPQPDEPEEVGLLRSDLIGLMADEGADPVLIAEAGRQARAWLANPQAIDPTMMSTVLIIAAQTGDAELFDGLLAKVRESTDRRERGAIFSALGSFREPELVARAQALLVTGEFDLREAREILSRQTSDRYIRRAAFDWLRGIYDTFAAQLPEQWRAALVWMVSGFCDPESRTEIADFFGPRLAEVSQGPIRLEQTLDGIDRCIAAREAQLPRVTEFLKAY